MFAFMDKGTTKGRVTMKKRMVALLTLTMSITMVSSVWAGVFDKYVDYQNPDGTYSYYFDQGVLVTLDENWYQNTIIKIEEQGVTFYQKASYDAWEKAGYEEGGRLFMIGASVNTGFSELPSFEYIGFDEDTCMNYYAELPTDYPAYMGDENIRAEYDALWAEARDVIAGIQIGTDVQIEDGAIQFESEDMIIKSTDLEDDDAKIKLGMKLDPELKWGAGLQLETDPNKELALKLEPDHLDMLVSLDGEEDDYYEELILTANGKKVPSSKIRWESDHPEIADVDELGWVTSKGIGTATITAYYGGEKLKCTIHVNQKITTDTVIIIEES